MIPTKICAECQALLEGVVVALRQHETQMTTGISLSMKGYLTEELRKEFAPVLVESFNVVQVAWDVYREHLIQHGLITPARKAVQPANRMMHRWSHK